MHGVNRDAERYLKDWMTKDALSSLLQRPLMVLLGTNDIDPKDKNLNRNEGAMKQGKHRFDRGNFYYQCGRSQAKAGRDQFEETSFKCLWTVFRDIPSAREIARCDMPLACKFLIANALSIPSRFAMMFQLACF